jgi:hypothetical protein
VGQKYAWLWDVNLDGEGFERILAGSEGVSIKQRQWAVVRLIEYAPWPEIQRLLPLDFFLEQWPELAARVRSRTPLDGMTFFHHRCRQQPLPHA